MIKQWTVLLSIALIIGMLLSILSRRFLTAIKNKIKDNPDIRAQAAYQVIEKLYYILLLAYIAFTLYTAHHFFAIPHYPFIMECIKSSLIIYTAFLICQYIFYYTNLFEDHDIAPILKYIGISVVVILAILILATNYQINISAILAFGGMGGIIIGFAVKEIIASYSATIIIHLEKLFIPGDWIRSENQEIEGIVESINFRVTTIRTFKKRPIYVPNIQILNMTIENVSRMSHRRIYEKIIVSSTGIPQLQKLTSIIEDFLNHHPDIDQQQSTLVYFNIIHLYGAEFFIYTYTKTTDWEEFHSIKESILTQVYVYIQEQDIEIPDPTIPVIPPTKTSTQ